MSTPFLSTSHTQAAGVLAGGTYRFRYRAANKYGWGPYSDEVVVQAADIPAQPAAATTTIADHYVRVSWTAPDDRSAAILEYEIRIRQSDGLTFTE